MPSKINSGLTRRRMLMAAACTSAAAVVGLPRLSHTETLSAITKRGFMTVATEDDYRPFEFMKDGKPTGYDQELLEMMKKKIGFDVHQDIIPWTGILPGVTNPGPRLHEPGRRLRGLLSQAQG
jgi:polar amino acid transport system substrate-binding protein